MASHSSSYEQEAANTIWRSWGAVYGNGGCCDRETIKSAVAAYDELGYEGFIQHGRASKTKCREAIANMICQAQHYGFRPSAFVPAEVRRLSNGLRLLRTQWTTGGMVGNILLGCFFFLISSDYRWMVTLNRD